MLQYITMVSWGYISSPITWICLLFGAMLGSFLNVCIYRIPEETFWSSHRSFCRNCKAKIPFYLNIPIFSYLFLRGKSKCCNTKISLQYPLVELTTAILLAFIYWKFPFIATIDGNYIIDSAEFIRFAHSLIFCSALLVCSVIDIHHMIIPDVISIPMICLTPLVVLVHPDLDWRSALYGVLVGGLSLYIVAWLYYLIRKEIGIGFGDVKLLAAIGGWLGVQSILPTILISSIVGSVVGIVGIVVVRKMSMKSSLPFGPFIALGAFLYLFAGTTLHNIILSINSLFFTVIE